LQVLRIRREVSGPLGAPDQVTSEIERGTLVLFPASFIKELLDRDSDQVGFRLLPLSGSAIQLGAQFRGYFQ